MASIPDLDHVEWHIVDDSTLVESSVDPDSGRTTYTRYVTERRVTEAEVLDRMRQLRVVLRRGDRPAKPLFGLVVLGLVGALVGWLVLGPVGVDEQVTATVFCGSVALLLIGVVALVSTGVLRQRALARLERDSAWSMYDGQGLQKRAAFELISTPDTVTVTQQAAQQ